MVSSGIAFSIDEVIRGYHIYKDNWDAEIGSECHAIRKVLIVKTGMLWQ